MTAALRALAVAALVASTAVLAAAPAAATQGAMPPFQAGFESGDWLEWNGYGAQTQPSMYPPARILDPLAEGVPRLQGGRVARLEVRPADARAGRTHAKLIRSWSVAEVSGSYRAWYYLPRGYRLRGRAWVNVFQFKEPYRCRGFCSDPSWYVVLSGAKPGHGVRPGAPVASVDRWDGRGRAPRRDRRLRFPTGRWVELRADLYQDDRIDFYLDGRRFDSVTDDQYPVGPMHGARSRAWAFGVGSYSGTAGDPDVYAATGPLYVDDVSFRPFGAGGDGG